MKRSVSILFRVNLAAMILIIAFLLGFFPINSAFAGERTWSGNVNGTIGGKWLESSDWAPVENQLEVGVEVDFRPPQWPFNLAFGVSGSAAEKDVNTSFGTLTATGTTAELDFGIKKIWEPPSQVRPFIGGGLAIISGKFEGEDLSGFSVSEEDSGVGVWAGGGVYVTLARHFNIGAEIKYSYAKITLFGVDTNAGGFHAGAFFGYHW